MRDGRGWCRATDLFYHLAHDVLVPVPVDPLLFPRRLDCLLGVVHDSLADTGSLQWQQQGGGPLVLERRGVGLGGLLAGIMGKRWAAALLPPGPADGDEVLRFRRLSAAGAQHRRQLRPPESPLKAAAEFPDEASRGRGG